MTVPALEDPSWRDHFVQAHLKNLKGIEFYFGKFCILNILYEISWNPPGTQDPNVDWRGPEIRIDRKTGVGIEEPVAEVGLAVRGLVEALPCNVPQSAEKAFLFFYFS